MELTWDLSQLYSSVQELNKDIDSLKNLGSRFFDFKDNLKSKEDLLKYYKLSESFQQLEDKIVSYLFFKKSLDGSDIFAIEKLAELEIYLQELANNTTFITQSIKKIPNKDLKLWSSLPEFADYDLAVLDIIKQKKHTLPEAQEKLMISAGFTVAHGEIFDCLDNVEIKFGKTKDESGKLVELNQSNLYVLSRSNNKQVRKAASQKMRKAYKAVNQTLAANFISHLKYANFEAKAYKYKNTLDMCLTGADLPAGLPQKVVKNVEKFLSLLYKYYAWRKNFMKLEKFESCDLVCQLFDKQTASKYTLQDAINIIKEALKPLGTDYTNMLDTAISQNWIDSRYLKNKDSGAYSADVYAVHPFILLTFDQTANSVSTLAHEFGHAMHSYYSEKSQPYAKHNYEYFVAEVASTVNEILLAEHMIATAKTKEEKIQNITEFLNTFLSTVFTQTQYTEFELFVHDSIDKGVPLSYKKLNDFYLSLMKKYCGKEVSVIKETQYNWSYIPHFYRNFYVFKYVTGFVAACAIVENLKNDPTYINKYIKFLSAGSSQKPCDLLKIADVDILSEKTYQLAMKIFEKYLNLL